MASMNPFDLLGDDDTEDPSQLIAAQQQKVDPPASKKAPVQLQKPNKPAANLPSKPLPPSQAVREAKNEGQRGGSRGGGGRRGGGRGREGGHEGGRGFYRDYGERENTYSSSNGFSRGYRASGDGDTGKLSERRGYGGPRGGFRGGRRGDFNNGEAVEGEQPRRIFERRSGTGRGNEVKREGAGRGNWGSPTDEIAPETEEPVSGVEKNVDTEKQPGQEDAGDENKDSPTKEQEEKEQEEKEMTLEEYEKVLEEKRKALLALKPEERKVDLDKEFQSMQLLSNRKNEDDVFAKLGSDKDKRKEAGEKAKKSVSINDFLKPTEGESYYRPGGRGRGRGHGRGGYNESSLSNVKAAPAIEDVGQFPSLVSK